MAKLNGKVVNLHRLEREEFVLAGGERVSPLQVTLDGSEMNAMLASHQAGFLVEKFEPIEAEDKSVTFRLRTNHERMVFRRERREAQAELSTHKKLDSDAAKV